MLLPSICFVLINTHTTSLAVKGYDEKNNIKWEISLPPGREEFTDPKLARLVGNLNLRADISQFWSSDRAACDMKLHSNT